MNKPTICAVNGGAAGYGADTAIGCDIRVFELFPRLLPRRTLLVTEQQMPDPFQVSCRAKKCVDRVSRCA